MAESLDAYRARLKETLKKNREAFEGRYGDELRDLLGLSRDDIDAVTPDVSDIETYDELIMVVKEASRGNLAQARLKEQIISMGEVAVSIAKKVPSLAVLL